MPSVARFETLHHALNRWGQRIYDSTTNPTWDGMVDGKQAPVDVYIFILDVECNGETRRLEQREVTLLR